MNIEKVTFLVKEVRYKTIEVSVATGYDMPKCYKVINIKEYES
tara:strand:- start:309 stop:437 length:129 start_codon:yes stop_codon:yes gene_type:complete